MLLRKYFKNLKSKMYKYKSSEVTPKLISDGYLKKLHLTFCAEIKCCK